MPKTVRSIIIPKPSKLYTSYCGYPLSEYGIAKYTQYNISIVIDHIKICEHGDRCERCCFPYEGPMEKISTQFRLRKPENIFLLPEKLLGIWLKKPNQISIHRFMFESIFGYQGRNIGVSYTCSMPNCANIHHTSVHRKNTIDRQLQLIKMCDHGMSCQICCWKWLGKIRQFENRLPRPYAVRYSSSESIEHVSMFLAKYILRFPIQKDSATTMGCGNSLCVNWHHVILRKMHDASRENIRLSKMWIKGQERANRNAA